MKTISLPLSLFITTLLTACAQPGANTPSVTTPVYLSESALPLDWPAPGPFYQVTRKQYPAYRAAFTASSSANGGFWTLFKHIKRNNIPMTAPVEMAMKDVPDGGMTMQQMGFLYQSPAVGKTGADGATVDVRDMPAVDVLSYAWQGPRDDAAVAKAKAAIDTVVGEKKLRTSGYRLFGYNSPSISRKKQTFELQAILK